MKLGATDDRVRMLKRNPQNMVFLGGIAKVLETLGKIN